MATITISNTAGNYDFSVPELDFKSFLNDYSYKQIDFVTKKQIDTVTLHQNDGDFLQLVGDRTLTGLENHDRLKAVVEVNSLSVGNGDEITYTITGLDLVTADVKTDKTLAAFANTQAYTILGNASDNALTGGNLADKLYGNGGKDELNGGNGKDKLYGGNGDDILNGGNQNDVLSGDAGNDKLNGGDGDDSLTGGLGKNILTGGKGDDTYYLGATDKIVEAKGKAGGVDTIVSASNTDLNKFSNVEDLVLTGSKGLKGYGDEGNNHITGNTGANTLAGGKGNDTLTGGKGADHFVFAKGDKIDTITDFVATGKGHDVIELDGFGKLKFANLDIEKHGKHDVDIDLGHGNHLILEHVNVKDLDSHDFQF